MPSFKKIYIEVTNCCNLVCNFCHQTTRSKGFMSPAVFADILEKIQGHTEHICLHVLGEPLLHPDFSQLLGISQRYGMRVNLTTNGTLLGRHHNTLLTGPALRQISISLHSLAQLEQENADTYLQDIITFAGTASATTSLYISLRLWNLHYEKTEQETDWNNWLLERLTAAFTRSTIRAEDLQAERGIPLAPRVFLNPEDQFDWPHPGAPDLGRKGYCRGGRDHLAVLVDGTVVPCCLDADGLLALGNIRQQPLEAILDGPRARQIREGFAQQRVVEPLCRRCTYRLYFSSRSSLSCDCGGQRLG